MNSFKFNYFLKDFVSKYSHISRYWELRVQNINLGKKEFGEEQSLNHEVCAVPIKGNIKWARYFHSS